MAWVRVPAHSRKPWSATLIPVLRQQRQEHPRGLPAAILAKLASRNPGERPCSKNQSRHLMSTHICVLSYTLKHTQVCMHTQTCTKHLYLLILHRLHTPHVITLYCLQHCDLWDRGPWKNLSMKTRIWRPGQELPNALERIIKTVHTHS